MFVLIVWFKVSCDYTIHGLILPSLVPTLHRDHYAKEYIPSKKLIICLLYSSFTWARPLIDLKGQYLSMDAVMWFYHQ